MRFRIALGAVFGKARGVLELRDVTLFIEQGGDVKPLLSDISAKYPRGHFGAIIGPSGCGKSTLLKVITGVAHGEEEGEVHWDGRNLMLHDFAPSEIGFVPQFSIAHEELAVRECVEYAMRLRVRGMHRDALREAVDRILDEVNMTEFADRLVQVLSGGQKRRLALAMELTSKPPILLCDEVTSGLDPQSEDEIVSLLHGLSRSDGRVVLSVTHSLRHLSYYDSVLVLYKGVVAYQGPPEFLGHYFRCDDPHDVFARLELREAKDWGQSWKKHRQAFMESVLKDDFDKIESKDKPDLDDELPAVAEVEILPAGKEAETLIDIEAEMQPQLDLPEEEPEGVPTPGILSQVLTLTERRFRMFSRNKVQILLQLGLILGFPVLVAIFAWNGLPAISNQTMGLNQNIVQQLLEAKDFIVQASKVGSLVSGIVMFEVILLTLMGANNSGREIAAERLIFEKEKLSGLDPLAYILSKGIFLGVLVVAQSVWMGLFVSFVCSFPGDLLTQLLFLLLVNAAMTSVCLAISAWMGSAEQASLVSIYLVGFQLPLSGAVLALPAWVASLAQPFIAAYWSWSGILETLKAERYYEIVQMVIQTSTAPASLCLWVLFSHVVIGIFVAWLGCHRSRMA